jgi:hypothetical protein
VRGGAGEEASVAIGLAVSQVLFRPVFYLIFTLPYFTVFYRIIRIENPNMHRVTNPDYFRQVKALRKLSQPVSVFIHHLETPGARASWLFPLFAALKEDVQTWMEDIQVILTFSPDTLFKVESAVERRWLGEHGSMAGLYGPQYLLAMILDHTMSPDFDDLPPQWLEECRTILERFYKDENELQNAEGELYDVVEHRVKFGDELKRAREALDALPDVGHSQVGKAAAKQIKALNHSPHKKWRLIFKKEMPLLYEIARRLLVMSTQSADVERVCKAHKVVHTKVRNRLNNKTVHQLLYCYVNLRLIKKIQDEKDQIASTRVDPDGCWEDFFEAALLDSIEDEREQVEEERELAEAEDGSVSSNSDGDDY